MFGSLMLDVAIGMVLVYLLLSFVAAAVREGVETLFKERSQFLQRGVTELLHDPDLTTALYSHPQVSALYRGDYAAAMGNKQLPSHIPSRNFARAQASIESWFDSSMDRVSGWYKHRTQRILVVIGIVVAIVANVDTIRVAHSFYNDPGQRQLAIAMAGSLTKEPPPGTSRAGDTTQTVRSDSLSTEMLHRLDGLKLPIGWPDPAFAREWSMRILGWLITGFAISFGAPFWFDLLNRMMVVRSTVKPDEKSPEESSKDKQSDKDKKSVTIVNAPPTV